MEKRTEMIEWKDSIMFKQLVIFGAVIITIMILTTLIHVGAINVARKATYDKMSANAEYYLGTIDNEINHIRNLQINFFSDRKLIYLSDSKVDITAYDKREALLSVKERLGSIDGISSLLGGITLYLPKSEYVITSSYIHRMEEEDVEKIKEYYGCVKGVPLENEQGFFMLENGSSKMEIDEGVHYLLVFTFPKTRLVERMSGVGNAEGEGAFFYSKNYGVIADRNKNHKLAEAIFKRLKRSEEGGFINAQIVSVDDESYLVFADESELLGTYIQYSREKPIMREIDQYRIYMYVVWGVIALLAIIFVLYTQKTIRDPINKLLQAFDSVRAGKFDEYIYYKNKNEFSYLYSGYNEMIDQINHLVNEVLLQKDLVQKVELKQLQAQINPHFLYNSFFVLSRRVKRHDYESAEKFAVLLGNYFKFLTRSGQDFIELRREVEHARCYAEIQATRFAGRIEVEFDELPPEYEEVKVPRLILQPLLENSFGHGLEDKVHNGKMKVSFEEAGDTFFIHVEDNGEMADDAVIARMQKSLDGEDNGEITGIINIHKRLGIYFEYRAGLRVTRSRLGGICMTIWIQGSKGAYYE